ncbi:ubiquinone biosynthesis O-methyltransferase [Paractinoplanes durhamensis]|uniref:Ubiquinone biosynthesis O-methyltransferase n=2 Tax=Paractinoplanes durhamensis TaxID=113563 RepID=A0ABQ3Z7M1_9ACTN|nr:ubiquinone biosynthesis O-methyltransferase [Actinoplanes durhamensis]
MRARLDHMRSISRNDPRQYDDLADQWWHPGGGFEMLHWLAEARAALIPPAARPGAVLVDAGCGGGLMAPHVAGKGYRHVGVDLGRTGLRLAAQRGVEPVNGDVAALPLASGVADVVAAGEILEHVTDLPGTVAELSRVLRPGGLVVIDTVNDNALSRFITVTAGERLGFAPPGIHDASLFVRPRRLIAEFARHGVRLDVRGARPTLGGLLRWRLLRGRPTRGRIVPTGLTAVLYQGTGRKDRERS